MVISCLVLLQTPTYTMKLFVVLSAVLALALAAPQQLDARNAQIVKYENDNIGVGPYSHGFETDNGISQQAQGDLTNVGTDNEASVVRGSYSYTGPDNVVYTVNYIADENGYRAEGAHLPKV